MEERKTSISKILLAAAVFITSVSIQAFALTNNGANDAAPGYAMSYAAFDDINGVILSDLAVTSVSSGIIKVEYKVTNNTSDILSRLNTIAYYKRSIDKSNFLVKRNLQRDVNPGETAVMTDTITYTGIASVPLILRIFDNGTTYPIANPEIFPIGNTAGNVLYQTFDPQETVVLSDLSVSRSSSSSIVTVMYTVTNNSSKAVSSGSYISFYKDSPDKENYLLCHTLKKSVPAGASVVVTDTLIQSNIVNYTLAARLFDYNGSFPILYPNTFYDCVTDNKTAIEKALEPHVGTVSISDFSVKTVNANKANITYTLTNNSNGVILSSSKIAFYQNSIDKSNYMFNRSIQKDIKPGESVVINDTVTYINIKNKRIVARLFDNGTTFPYMSPNRLVDDNLTNKVVSGSSFNTKIVCVGDSITAGYGIPSKDNYPSQLQNKLGDDYVVVNLGVSATALNRSSDLPYSKHLYYQMALNAEPDIVLIMIGSNDTRPPNNTPELLSTFKAEYTSFVRSFVNLPNHPKVYLVTPVTVPSSAASIMESLLAEQIRPDIRAVSAELNLPLVEFEYLLSGDRSNYSIDNIHPSKKGYDLMSNVFYDVLTR